MKRLLVLAGLVLFVASTSGCCRTWPWRKWGAQTPSCGTGTVYEGAVLTQPGTTTLLPAPIEPTGAN